MAKVVVKENESLDSVLKRFRRECYVAGIIEEMKKREFYLKPSERRRLANKRKKK